MPHKSRDAQYGSGIIQIRSSSWYTAEWEARTEEGEGGSRMSGGVPASTRVGQVSRPMQECDQRIAEDSQDLGHLADANPADILTKGDTSDVMSGFDAPVTVNERQEILQEGVDRGRLHGK